MKKVSLTPKKLPLPRGTKIGLIAAPGLLVYLLVAWLLGGWLGLRGWELWVLRSLLLFLGLAAAGLVFWYLSKRGAEPAQADELDAAIATANARLSSSRVPGGASLNALPLVLVVGPTGSTKTTTVVRSGLNPDLLAGEVFRGDTISPTPGVNLWYSQGTVFLEAGGSLTADPSRRQRLIPYLQPERLAAFFGRPPAPRRALVCFSCEDLLQPGASQAVPAAARELREQLTQVAHALGIRLPVYVLFTKADRIPYFADYVRNFSRDEARQVLGATLPLPLDDASASHEFRRLSDAFQRIYRSLAAGRLQVLAREPSGEIKGQAYEFVREFRKLGDLAVQFLSEICRPSELEVSPFLRGFYFAGVRAVIASDSAAEAAPQIAAAEEPGRVAATQLFDRSRHPPPTPQAPAAAPTSRKVPQWMFLERLFRDVVLRDRIASGLTQHGAHVDMWRRIALGGVVVMSLLLSSAFTLSCFLNRRLEGRALDAARALPGLVTAPTGLPSVRELAALEDLRAQVDVLGEYERSRPKMRLRWGLYTGSAIYPSLQRIYLDRFQTLLLDPARAALLDSLRRLPAAGDDPGAFDRGYEQLKAYLMITRHPERVDPGLAPVLMQLWLNDRQIDPEGRELALGQFEFYAGVLCRDADTLCQAAADDRTVRRAQTFLGQFTGPERYYQIIVLAATKDNPAIQFNRDYPESLGVVENRYEVPGAFTAGGWALVQGGLENVDQLLTAEDWVLGEEARTPPDPDKLARDLQSRYQDDYVRHWLAFLREAKVASFDGLRQAAQRLASLGSAKSPLLQMFSVAATQTDVDTLTVGKAFQPVSFLTPPGADKFVVESNQDYVKALIALQSSIERLASAPGAAEAETDQALADADQARSAVRQLALNFNVEGAAGDVADAVQRLLREPIENVTPQLRGHGLGRLTRTLQEFCGDARTLMTKLPFNPSADQPATIEEVSGMFHRENGELWILYNDLLQNSLVPRGQQYSFRSGVSPRPTDAFLRFFNRAAGFSKALYSSGATGPELEFTFRARPSQNLPRIEFSVDGRTEEFTLTSIPTPRFLWKGEQAQEVRLTAYVRGRPETLRFLGRWALFQLFQQASWRSTGSSGHVVEWVIRPAEGGQLTLTAELQLGQAQPILKRDYFDGIRWDCRFER